MAVSLVSGQSASTYVEGPGNFTLAFPGNVTSGNLVTVTLFSFRTGTTAWLGSHVAKNAGTATIGTPTVDVQIYRNNGSGEYYGAVTWSVPVTGSGSLTLQVTQPNGDFSECVIREYTGADVTSSRLEDYSSATNNSANASSGDSTSAGGALFIGAFGEDAEGTITPDAAFAEIVERQSWVAGSIIQRIVTSGTTDAASWTSPSGNWGAICAVYKEASTGLSVTGSNISAGSALYAPTVTRGAVTVTGTTIASGSALYAPTVTPPATAVTGTTITSGSSINAPTVAVGAVTVSGATITSGAALYAPTASPGAVAVTGSTIASGAALNAPTVAPSAVAVSGATITSSASLYAATLAPGAVTVQGATIASGSSLYAPTVGAGGTAVEAATIASAESLYVPTAAYQIAASLIASALTLFAPSVAPGAVTVQGATISAGTSLQTDAIHYWRMEETSGTRDDAAGSSDMTEYGGTVGYTAGQSGNAASFAGGSNPYLRSPEFSVSGDFTISAWGKVSSGSFGMYGPAGGVGAIISASGIAEVAVWDPVSGDGITATKVTGVSIADDWVLIVARFNQTSHTMNMRLYGFGANNAETIDGVPQGTGWVNSHTSLVLWPSYISASTAGALDELAFFDRLLTDAECDLLQERFWPFGLYAPTVTAGAATVQGATIGSTAVLYEPTVSTGAVTVITDTIASGATLGQPSVGVGSAEIDGATIASAETLYAPTVTAGAVTVTGDTIASGSTLYAPTVTTGAVTVEGATITSGAEFYAPAVGVSSIEVEGATIASGDTLYAPTVTTGAVEVGTETIASGSSPWPPSVGIAATEVTGDTIASGELLYAPGITVGAVAVELATIDAGTTLYAPTVSTSALAVPQMYPGLVVRMAVYIFNS